MIDTERIKKMGDGGPKIELFQMWQRPNFREIPKLFEGPLPFLADFVDYDERVVSSYRSYCSGTNFAKQHVF